MSGHTKQLRDTALQYLQHGFSIIPVGKDKVPLIKWEQYQDKPANEESVTRWFVQWPAAQIGIITGKVSGIVVVDIDDLDKTDIWNLIPYDPATIPTSKTPRGLHLYFKLPFRGSNPKSQSLTNNAGLVPGCDLRGEGGYVVAYEWLPGQSIFEIDPPELPTEYLQYIKSVGVSYQPKVSNETVIPEGQRDERLFHLANRLFRGGASVDEVREHLTIFANACDPPFPPKELDAKVESALKRDTARSGSLAQEVRDWIGTIEGTFSRQDIYTELHIGTKGDKENIHKILQRVQDEGIIEKVGKKYGIWRRREQGFERLRIGIEDSDELSLFWPLEVHHLYAALPKSIGVIAGYPNAGKTAFCLNFAMMNKDHFTIRYITSELGESKLNKRLKKFGIPWREWQTIEFIELKDNYLDAVLPEQITIIDFLEIHDEFWKVSGWINDIFRKLTTGFCLIALQKPGSRDVGRGGEGTLEKPSIYLSMGGNTLKIVKCKEWADDMNNPNGQSIEFKLYGGHEFKPQSEWGVPMEEVRK